MSDQQQPSADGAQPKITIVQHTKVVRVRVRTVAVLSMGRLATMVLMWIGVPVGLLILPAFPPADPGAAFFRGWMLAGLATLALNASGILTVRGRRRERIEGEGEAEAG